MRVKVFTVGGSTQFAPLPDQGLITLPADLDPRQVVEVPKLGIICPGGGIGDLLIYWFNPIGLGRIPIATGLEASMTDPDGDASIAVCPGIAPRSTSVASDGTTTNVVWHLGIQSLNSVPKTQAAVVSYTIQVSPAPNEVET